MTSSRRALATALAALAGIPVMAAVAAPATARAGVSPAAPRAALTAIACRSSSQPDLRRASVTAVMRHVPGTRRLSIRLTLLERASGEPARAVRGGDLGRWISPAVITLGRAPHDVWRLAKAVYGVPAPATYRFRVDFRWQGAGGRVIASERLRTGVCAVRPG